MSQYMDDFSDEEDVSTSAFIGSQTMLPSNQPYRPTPTHKPFTFPSFDFNVVQPLQQQQQQQHAKQAVGLQQMTPLGKRKGST